MNNNEPVTTAVTVGEILDRYERECLPDLSPRTQKDYGRHLGHLRARFGALNALELEPKTFAEYLNVRKGRFYRIRHLAVLSSAFTIAVRRWFWLKINVLRDVERPKGKPRDRLILDEEFHRCKAFGTERVQLAMQLALLTGQRQGDIISFRWSDIRETVVDGRKVTELHIQQGKTGKRLAIEIEADLERVLDRCWLLKNGGSAGCAYILPTERGTPYTSEGFRAVWQRTIGKYCKAGGDRFTFHDIRALAATKCPTIEAAQQLLGHTNPALTRKVYRRGVERVRPLRLSVIKGGLSDGASAA